MKVIFAGTPPFARTALAAIRGAGHEVVLVLTQPDRPSGRGMKAHPSAVKSYALAAGMPLLQPPSLRLDGKYPTEAASAHAQLRAARHDVMVVAAYGLILPPPLLAIAPWGCLNIHASLLPRWRGAAPVQRAIEAGDERTGVTIMQMEAGLDTGPMLLQQGLEIEADETAGMLTERLATLGADLILKSLSALAEGRLESRVQPAEGVTYAAKIQKSETLLDFSLPAEQLVRKIRAFSPAPGACAAYRGVTLKFWSASAAPATSGAAPATVLFADSGVVAIACGEGQLLVREFQKPGGTRLKTHEFLKGFPLEAGARFG